ncbi:MAG TPA: hypothetical protein VGA58_09610 [bacterium]
MFIGVLGGFVLGLLLVAFVRLPFANWPKFIESVGIGFGIGLAFITLTTLLNFAIKFMDEQSQKVKSGGT